MRPADRTLRASFRAGLDRSTVAVRLKNIGGAKSNADIAGLAPRQVDIKRKWSLGIIVFALWGRLRHGFLDPARISHDITSSKMVIQHISRKTYSYLWRFLCEDATIFVLFFTIDLDAVLCFFVFATGFLAGLADFFDIAALRS